MKDQLNEGAFDSELPPFEFDHSEWEEDGSKNKKDQQVYKMRRSIEDHMEEKRLQDLIKDWEGDDELDG